VESILTRHGTLAGNLKPLGAFLVTLALGLFIAARLFRWEKDEKLRRSAKLWVAAVLAPFVLLGVNQLRTNEQMVRNRVLWRQLQREDAFLVRNGRVFVGDGYKDVKDYLNEDVTARALAQYLCCGVAAVKSAGDLLRSSLALRAREAAGELQGAELFVSGPLFTTEGGHGTEIFSWLPPPAQTAAQAEFVRTPKTPDEARAQVRELKKAGVYAIKAVLETGRTGALFERMDLAMFRAVASEAIADRLPVALHTGSAADVADAVGASVSSTESVGS
jgi:hypothetical protein